MNTTLKHLKMRLVSSVFVVVLTTLFLTAGVAQAAALTCGTWSVVTSPDIGAIAPRLNGVVAVSTNDVWAVGAKGTHTLAEHWNGTSWNLIASPSPGNDINILSAVAAVSTNDVW